MSVIKIERVGRVGVLTLNRPEALNAINRQLTTELINSAQTLDADPSIGAIVVTGAGRAFAAGADITELAEETFASMTGRAAFAEWDVFAAIRTPKIAAVNGLALGGGCELALMCDIIIAADTARFGLPEVRLGLIPGMGGTQRMARALGKAKTMELVLTGGTLDADQAEAAQLISRVVPSAELLAEAHKTASAIAAMSTPTIYGAKEAVEAAFVTTLDEGIRIERRIFHSMFALNDAHEGMAAFREKRAASFQNN